MTEFDDDEWYVSEAKHCPLTECEWIYPTVYSHRHDVCRKRITVGSIIKFEFVEHIKTHSRADQSRIFEVKE